MIDQLEDSAKYPGAFCPGKRTLAELYPIPAVHGNRSMCSPSPFAPHGGAKEWNSNDLILKDDCMRKLAYIAPLDCALNAVYYVNKIPKL